MPNYEYYLYKKVTVYKAIEAENLDQANEIVDEFIHSDHIDWSLGEDDAELSVGYIGRIEND